VRVPQRVTIVTLGARSMSTLRAFYAALGWAEREGSDEGFTAYDAGTVRLALFPLERLALEAAPGEPPPSGWNGVTLAINVESVEAVDAVFRSALHAGARLVAEPVRREWGGYSGYIADPEGNRWEIAWAPE
jgi:uncharacterized protein